MCNTHCIYYSSTSHCLIVEIQPSHYSPLDSLGTHVSSPRLFGCLCASPLVRSPLSPTLRPGFTFHCALSSAVHGILDTLLQRHGKHLIYIPSMSPFYHVTISRYSEPLHLHWFYVHWYIIQSCFFLSFLPDFS